jgi:hypothetical protein
MLSISERQFQLLADVSVDSFERRMLKHMRQYLPEECTKYSDEQLREVIRRGIADASEYGIRAEKNVATYLDVMLWLTADSERHARLSRVPEILRDPGIPSESDRVEILVGYVFHQMPN